MTRKERARRIGQAVGEILVHLDVLRTPVESAQAETPDVEAEFTERELSSGEQALRGVDDEEASSPRPPGREIDPEIGEESYDADLMEQAGFGDVAPGVAITAN